MIIAFRISLILLMLIGGWIGMNDVDNNFNSAVGVFFISGMFFLMSILIK